MAEMMRAASGLNCLTCSRRELTATRVWCSAMVLRRLRRHSQTTEVPKGISPSGVPHRVIDKMVAEAQHRAVGGATSIGAAYQRGFELFCAVEPVTHGHHATR